MKLGVAISGCGIGAVTAYRIPALLGRMGLVPDAYSCCSVAALPMGLMGLGTPEPELPGLMTAWAEGLFSGRLKKKAFPTGPVSAHERPRVLICAADAIAARPVVFSIGAGDEPGLLPCDASLFREVLPGALGLTWGFKPKRWKGRLLCDFSIYFGNPLFPLKQLGAERTLLIRFESDLREPIVVSADRMSRQGEALATAVVRLPAISYHKGEDCIRQAGETLQQAFETRRQEILEQLVF